MKIKIKIKIYMLLKDKGIIQIPRSTLTPVHQVWEAINFDLLPKYQEEIEC